jgi:plastocyanin
MRKLFALMLVAAVTAVLAVPATAGTRGSKVGDNYFSPRGITISKGSYVRWRWVGRSPHNVALRRGPAGVRKFKSRTQRSGTYRKRFTRRGTYRIWCTIHGTQQRQTVTVR